jgi:hypothetical protein
MENSDIHFSHCQKFAESCRRYAPKVIRTQDQNINSSENTNYVTYWCPICLNNGIICLEGKMYLTSEFNMDHYPPDNSGGHFTALVCKTCNSTAGTLYENELKKELQVRSFNKGIAGSALFTKATIKDVPGGPYKGSLKIHDDGNKILDFGQLARTPYVENWHERIKANPNKFEIKVEGTFANQKKVQKALVKSAYLYCFTRYGYEFSVSPGGSAMRKYIIGEADYPIPDQILYWQEDNFQNIPEGIAFISKPSEMLTYIVNVPLCLKETGYKCVVGIPYPNPTKTCWEDLNKLYPFKHVGPLDFTYLSSLPEGTIVNYANEWEAIVNGTIEIRPASNS